MNTVIVLVADGNGQDLHEVPVTAINPDVAMQLARAAVLAQTQRPAGMVLAVLTQEDLERMLTHLKALG